MIRTLAVATLALSFVTPLHAGDCSSDDPWEDNDSCSEAAYITAGFYHDLVVFTDHAGPPDSDYFLINVPAGHELRVVLTDPDGSFFTPQAQIYDYHADTCGAMTYPGWLASSYEETYTSTVVWRNERATPRACVIEVEDVTGGANCLRYDMLVEVQPDPCQALPDDAYEPNDRCEDAAVIPPGFHADLWHTDARPDYYKVTLQPDEELFIDMLYAVDGSRPELEVYRLGLQCAEDIVVYTPNVGQHRAYVFNDYDIPRDVYFRTTLRYAQCEPYSLNLLRRQNMCTLGIDDVLEGPDDCGAPVALAPGTYEDLYVEEFDLDYYEVLVPPASALSVDTSWFNDVLSGPEPTISTGFRTANCAEPFSNVEYDDGSGYERVYWRNETGAAVPVTVTIGVSQDCSLYDMTIAFVDDPCLQDGFQDELEPDDDCATATPIPLTGWAYQGLTLSKHDPDIFTLTVPAGARIVADALTVPAEHELNLYLVGEGAPLDCEFSLGDPPLTGAVDTDGALRLTWTNATGVAQTYYLWARSDGSQFNSFCGRYDLVVSVELPADVVGTRTCFGDGVAMLCPCVNLSDTEDEAGCVNSTGRGARIEMTGTSDLSLGGAVAHLQQGASSQPAALLQGSTQILAPFNDGLLCAGGNVVRIEETWTNSLGDVSTTVVLQAAGDLFPGESRIYQWWYRDAHLSTCGTDANLSSAMTVDWQ